MRLEQAPTVPVASLARNDEGEGRGVGARGPVTLVYPEQPGHLPDVLHARDVEGLVLDGGAKGAGQS